LTAEHPLAVLLSKLIGIIIIFHNNKQFDIKIYYKNFKTLSNIIIINQKRVRYFLKTFSNNHINSFLIFQFFLNELCVEIKNCQNLL